MKIKTLSIVIALLVVVCSYSQKLSLNLTFTAIDNTTYIQLDSIKVMNRTQNSDIMLHWPDTSLTYDITAGDTLLYVGYVTGSPIGFEDIYYERNTFKLLQNYPNPVNDQTIFSVATPEKGNIQFVVTDITGKEVLRSESMLDKGLHSFRFSPGRGNIFLLIARWNGTVQSIKIITTGNNTQNSCNIEYIGSQQADIKLKSSHFSKGYAYESGILDDPASDKTYTFQFAYNIPCPGTPSVDYSGQVYNTVQIFSQCWLKENLNVGTVINSSTNMTDNGAIEKYCYDDIQFNCTKYGGLYKWDEMMQYTTQQGAQGICPSGWHIPTDDEWKVLEGAADSQFWIGDAEWDDIAIRGFDSGTNLRANSGWESPGNGPDYFGFAGLPGGISNDANVFFLIGFYGYWWSSTEYGTSNAWEHFLNYNSPEAYRLNNVKGYSFNVRCVMD